MVDPDVLAAKLDVIDRCLRRISEVRGERRKELQPIDVDDITALNLQRAIQAAIDLAAHVVAEEGYGVSGSAGGVFTLLEQRGVIEAALAERLRRMVGFRNIAIHEYRSVDPAIVETIVEKHLDDLRDLGARVWEDFGSTDPSEGS